MHCGVTFYFLGILAVRHSSPLECVLSIYEALGSVFIPEYLRKERKREKMEQEQEDEAAAGTHKPTSGVGYANLVLSLHFRWWLSHHLSSAPNGDVCLATAVARKGGEGYKTPDSTASASGQICLVADVASETQVAFGKYLFRE